MIFFELFLKKQRLKWKNGGNPAKSEGYRHKQFIYNFQNLNIFLLNVTNFVNLKLLLNFQILQIL